MAVTISFSADALDLCIDKGSATAPLTRSFKNEDFASLSAWVAEYGSIVGRSSVEGQLLSLERALFVELLATKDGYLAQDAGLLYCPVRRLGVAGASLPLGAHCLGLTFMAAAPRRGACGARLGRLGL